MSEGRYILCRPEGGCNDTLVQIVRCLEYAIEHDRVLIVDAEASGFRKSIDSIFQITPESARHWRPYSRQTLEKLNALTSVRPKEVTGRLNAYRSENVRTENGDFFRAETASKVKLSFDFDRDHSEDLLLHHQFGGGRRSLGMFRYFQLDRAIANEVLQRILQVRPGYVALHLRHTEARSDLHTFLGDVAPVVSGKHVVVCTDNPDVQRLSLARLSHLAEVEFVTEPPEFNGEPLWSRSDYAGSVAATVDLFADLFALALSDVIAFPPFVRPSGSPGISGFALLGEGLRSQPILVRHSLAASDKDLFLCLEERLLERHRRTVDTDVTLGSDGAKIAERKAAARRLAKQYARDLAP